jgi:hypothetical protein
MSVSLDHVIHAARSGAAALAPELCGYIVLGAADQVARAPCQLLTTGVELGAEGEVRISAGRATDELAAEGSLRRLLSQLLEAARAGSPALERASRRPVGHGVLTFVGEIEAALVPVNRGAARRALARLHREAMRAPVPARIDPVDHAADLQMSEKSVPVEVPAAERPRAPHPQPARPQQGRAAPETPLPVATVVRSRESSPPVRVMPDVAEPPSNDETDPMDTGYGSLPRAEHGRPACESTHREPDGQTPKLGSIAVRVPEAERDEYERLSWSGGAIHVEVDDLGDETPVLDRPEPGSCALPPSPPSERLPATEKETLAPADPNGVDGEPVVEAPSILPTIPAPDLSLPAPANAAAILCGAPVSRLEALVEGFSAEECGSVRELCRELQQIAGLEGGDGQSSLPPPVATEKRP